MDGVEKAMFEQQQQALFRQWITSPSAGYARQNPDGTPYRDPQPTLTDEERGALAVAIEAAENARWHETALVLARILQRLK